MSNIVIFGDNLEILKTFPDEFVELIYIDPPFNTGKDQKRQQGNDVLKYKDRFGDLVEFLEPRMKEAYRILKDNGTLYFHIDYREVHYCKIMLDQIFGRDCFMNEIIWAYDYGGRSRTKWPCKHDNVLAYVKDPENYTFNYDAMDRIPYMSPGLVGPEKTALGKTPTDVWWHTIVPTNGREKTGYPTQKPEGVLKRIVSVSSNPGDTVLDFFAGSGTTGKVALDLGREFILIDNNEQAMGIMRNRFHSTQLSPRFIRLLPGSESFIPYEKEIYENVENDSD